MTIVLVGVLIDPLEEEWRVVAEKWLLENGGALQEEVPLLHDLVRPHVDGWRIQVVFQALNYRIVTLHILVSIDLISSAL